MFLKKFKYRIIYSFSFAFIFLGIAKINVYTNKIIIVNSIFLFPIIIGIIVGFIIGSKTDKLFNEIKKKTKQLRLQLKQKEILEHKLRELSFKDELTGVLNRRAFDRILKREWRRCIAIDKHISLIMLDVDKFKEYNDFYGHEMGDIALKKVAQLISKIPSKEVDVVARYGGEEFTIILPGAKSDVAKDIAKQVVNIFRIEKFKHEKSDIGILTVSLGVATMKPNKKEDEKYLLKLADIELYKIKKTGRNGFSSIYSK